MLILSSINIKFILDRVLYVSVLYVLVLYFPVLYVLVLYAKCPEITSDVNWQHINTNELYIC